jgi:hypothetical protein
MKKLTLFSFFLSLVVCAAVFNLKSRVNAMSAHMSETRLAIAEAEQSLHVLRAEWAHVSQPEFLQYLVDNHTTLVPPNAQQFASIDMLPEPINLAQNGALITATQTASINPDAWESAQSIPTRQR